MNNKYPKVNYIGNKERVASWIIESLPINSGTVLDLFCGGGSVSYELKKNGFSVISNDILYSSYVLSKAIIENDEQILNREDYLNLNIEESEIEKKYNQLCFLSDKLYFDYEVKELAELCLIAEKLPEYKKYIFLALLRRAMIRKIPYSRMNIEWKEIKKLRDEDYSYKKYGRYRSYHNRTFINHINENLDAYNESVFYNGTKCKALQMDALECVEHIEDHIDLIYMDPPYPSTMNEYVSFYGPFDQLFNCQKEVKTNLTDKKTYLNAFRELVYAAARKTFYIAISINNKCSLSVDTLLSSFSPIIESYNVYKKEHAYKVTGKDNKHSNYEILFVFKVKRG